MGKLLIIAGVFLIVLGILLSAGIPYLGKLPGDIHIAGENYSIYIPITTGLILSLILSLVYYLLSS